MGISLADDVKKLIDRANFAHSATILPDGSPHSAPVWIAREGDLLLICTEATSLKGKNTQRDPRVSLSIVDFRDPYTEAQIRGRGIAQRPDPQLQWRAGRCRVNLPGPVAEGESHYYLRRLPSTAKNSRPRRNILPTNWQY